jgi:phosphohistidine phosphatase
MKTLILLRHAKSSWNNPNLTDFQRPLNKRGQRDAPFMANVLKKTGIKVEKLIASPAERTLTTAQIFADKLDYPFDEIVTEPSLYDESFNYFLQVIRNIKDSCNTAMIVSHNPYTTSMINYLANYNLTNLPTCGCFGIALNVSHWKDAAENTGKCLFYEYPKKYFNKDED